MKKHLGSARRALKARRADRQEWARLERVLAPRVSPAEQTDLALALGPGAGGSDGLEMQRYLAAQTAQLV